MMKKKERGSQKGIAIFMVMSAIAVLSVLLTELTYSTQLNARLAFNFRDELKAYYLAKAAYKLSLVRLAAFNQVEHYLASNKKIASAVPAGVIDKIWSIPMMYPMPIPKQAALGQAGAIKDFMKKSALGGKYVAEITGLSSKLNLNEIFVKQIKAPKGPSGASGATGGTVPSGASKTKTQQVNFRAVLEPAIDSALAHKKQNDQDFAEAYQNVRGKDIVDAIYDYIFPNQPPSELPGFTPIRPKEAPFYSLSELHLIPGIDDGLYNLLKPLLTVYSTPGFNVSTIDKQTLMALVPELTPNEAADMIRKRDDKDVGKPWATPDDFWKALKGEPSAAQSMDQIKNRLTKAGITITTKESSFKITVVANVGLATRQLEAYVVLDNGQTSQSPKKPTNGFFGELPNTMGANNSQNTLGQNGTSAKNSAKVHLIYWRML